MLIDVSGWELHECVSVLKVYFRAWRNRFRRRDPESYAKVCKGSPVCMIFAGESAKQQAV